MAVHWYKVMHYFTVNMFQSTAKKSPVRFEYKKSDYYSYIVLSVVLVTHMHTHTPTCMQNGMPVLIALIMLILGIIGERQCKSERA